MLFAHDTVSALTSAAALVNTASAGTLETVDELAEFVELWGWTGDRHGTLAELDGVRALRGELRAVWESDLDGAVQIINRLLLDAHALPQLVRHGDWDWHLHATDPSAPLADRMAVEAAMGLVDVVRTGELDRLRICAADDCDDVLVDLSKNRSRRYCEKGCGNRTNVAAYRARRAGDS